MKAYMCGNMKAKHTSIQKSYGFVDPKYIFSENGSKTAIRKFSFPVCFATKGLPVSFFHIFMTY